MSMQTTAAGAHAQGGIVCTECGAAASGNFCSTCGADLQGGARGVLGAVAAPARRSFPAVYLQILRAPVTATVRFSEDPTYRGHISFLLTGIAIFCLLFIPVLLQGSVPDDATAHLSEDIRTLAKAMSQVGVYVGAVIGFLLTFGLFRAFAREPRTLPAYFKLYCMAFGFVTPLYAVYEFAARSLLGGTGMSSLNGPLTETQLATPSALISIALSLTLWAYFIAVHRRFWRMPLWKAGVLYVVAAVVSYQLSYWTMFYVGQWTRDTLLAAGLITA